MARHPSLMTHFDLVGVHAGVGDEDVHVLHPLGLVHADLLVQQETWNNARLPTWPRTPAAADLTFVQVGVGQAAAELLDDVDGVQVPGALQPHDGVHRQLGEVVLVVRQQLGGQRRAGDVQEVLLEAGRVVAMETAAPAFSKRRKPAAASGGVTSDLWSAAASLRASLATCVAFRHPAMMVWGWIFLDTRSSASCGNRLMA